MSNFKLMEEDHWVLTCDSSNNIILLNLNPIYYDKNRSHCFCQNDPYKICITTDEEIEKYKNSKNSYFKNKENEEKKRKKREEKKQIIYYYVHSLLRRSSGIGKENKNIYNLLKILKYKKNLGMKILRNKYYDDYYHDMFVAEKEMHLYSLKNYGDEQKYSFDLYKNLYKSVSKIKGIQKGRINTNKNKMYDDNFDDDKDKN